MDAALLPHLPPGLIHLAVTGLGQTAIAVAAVAGAWIVGELARRLIVRIGDRDIRRRDIFRLLAKAAKITAIGLGAVMALGTVGVDVTAVVAGLGVAGLAAGFAFKEILSGLLAGLMILMHRPFSAGDRIEVVGLKGQVENIDLRYTTISGEGQTLLIPNATLLTNPVTVRGHSDSGTAATDDNATNPSNPIRKEKPMNAIENKQQDKVREERREMIEGLSHILADTYALGLKTQKFHWNVTGPMFGTLHEMFEGQYKEIDAAIDNIAERIRALGAEAPGSFAEFADFAAIRDSVDPIPADKMVSELLADHRVVAATSEHVFRLAEKAGDEPTADMMVGRMHAHENAAWMLRSMLG